MKKVVIDFETRSRVDLKVSGTWRYALDESTEVLCLGFAIDNGPADVWVPGEAAPSELTAAILAGAEIEAHNAMFERSIWECVMVERHGWPAIKPEQWRCTAARASALALPRQLHQAGEALGIQNKKDMEDRKIMLKLCKPKADGKFHNKYSDFATLFSYCKKDVLAEREISGLIRELPTSELELWQLDQKINARGVRVDLPFVKAAAKAIDEYTVEKSKELQTLTKGAVTSASERDKLLNWLLEQGAEMDGLTKTKVEDILKTELPENIKQVLLIRQELGKTSTAKYYAILESVCPDERLRDLLMYHGASTGRWSGKGVQPQNFKKQGLKDVEQCIRILKKEGLEGLRFVYPDVMKTLSDIIRGVFIPSEGKKMFGGDYSSIEARVLFWIAGEEKGLRMFAEGTDLYVDLAKVIYPGQEITKEKRELGKRGILGAGFGMGAKKFKLTCEAGGISISEELADKTIKAYRSKYHPVQKFWQDVESAAIEAVKTGKPVKCGKVMWALHGGFLYCKLPSGRCIAYAKPTVRPKETPWGDVKDALVFWSVDSKTKRWAETSAYGGLLCENIVQATARDITASAMLRSERAGYEVLLTVHDELLTEKESGSKEEFKRLMEVLPEWAAGLPVKAETWEGMRYGK